jgi:DnaJ-class molecular chaperone
MLQLRFLDHYKLLDVNEDASPAEIGRAHAAAINGLPDSWIGRCVAGLGGRTKERYRIAYEELSDLNKREKYDRYLDRGRNMMLSLIH